MLIHTAGWTGTIGVIQFFLSVLTVSRLHRGLAYLRLQPYIPCPTFLLTIVIPDSSPGQVHLLPYVRRPSSTPAVMNPLWSESTQILQAGTQPPRLGRNLNV